MLRRVLYLLCSLPFKPRLDGLGASTARQNLKRRLRLHHRIFGGAPFNLFFLPNNDTSSAVPIPSPAGVTPCWLACIFQLFNLFYSPTLSFTMRGEVCWSPYLLILIPPRCLLSPHPVLPPLNHPPSTVNGYTLNSHGTIQCSSSLDTNAVSFFR